MTMLLDTAREFSLTIERAFQEFDRITSEMVELRLQFEFIKLQPRAERQKDPQTGREILRTPADIALELQLAQKHRETWAALIASLLGGGSVEEARAKKTKIVSLYQRIVTLNELKLAINIGYEPDESDILKLGLKLTQNIIDVIALATTDTHNLLSSIMQLENHFELSNVPLSEVPGSSLLIQ